MKDAHEQKSLNQQIAKVQYVCQDPALAYPKAQFGPLLVHTVLAIHFPCHVTCNPYLRGSALIPPHMWNDQTSTLQFTIVSFNTQLIHGKRISPFLHFQIGPSLRNEGGHDDCAVPIATHSLALLPKSYPFRFSIKIRLINQVICIQSKSQQTQNIRLKIIFKCVQRKAWAKSSHLSMSLCFPAGLLLQACLKYL